VFKWIENIFTDEAIAAMATARQDNDAIDASKLN